MKISISSKLVEAEKCIRKNFYTAKFRTANSFYGEIFVRRNIRTAKFPTAKLPSGENSLRRNFLMANFPHGGISFGEISHSEISYGEISGHGLIYLYFWQGRYWPRLLTLKHTSLSATFFYRRGIQSHLVDDCSWKFTAKLCRSFPNLPWYFPTWKIFTNIYNRDVQTSYSLRGSCWFVFCKEAKKHAGFGMKVIGVKSV